MALAGQVSIAEPHLQPNQSTLCAGMKGHNETYSKLGICIFTLFYSQVLKVFHSDNSPYSGHSPY
jgi:hypothetical protein